MRDPIRVRVRNRIPVCKPDDYKMENGRRRKVAWKIDWEDRETNGWLFPELSTEGIQFKETDPTGQFYGWGFEGTEHRRKIKIMNMNSDGKLYHYFVVLEKDGDRIECDPSIKNKTSGIVSERTLGIAAAAFGAAAILALGLFLNERLHDRDD